MDSMTQVAPATSFDSNGDIELADLNLNPPDTGSKNATVADSKTVNGDTFKPLTDSQIAQAADRIRARNSQAIDCIVQNGRDLIAVKESLGHGKFMPWFAKQFRAWSERTAQNYMSAARNYDELISANCTAKEIAIISPTVLYGYGKFNDEEKAKIVKRLKQGAVDKSQAFKAKGNKTGNSKKADVKGDKVAGAAPDNLKNAAERLVKITSERLGRAFAVEHSGHPGFQSPEFGKLLSKALNNSFGVPSNGGDA